MVNETLVSILVERIRAASAELDRPMLVALDGRSGAGKSTLSVAVAEQLCDCAIIEGDQFYNGGTGDEWDQRSAEENASNAFDWCRQRPALEALRLGQTASWLEYDWETFDGNLRTEPTTSAPAAVVILEGVYSARPELADLFDLRVLLDTPPPVRMQRLAGRESQTYCDGWFARWDPAEQHYFGTVMQSGAFDLVLQDR